MRRLISILTFFLVAYTCQMEARAQSKPNLNDPIMFTADEVIHDRELGVVTAKGNVEISQNERVLIADLISYNQRQNILSASGNVSLMEPSGDVLFAEFMELSGDLKNGILKRLRIRLSDNARIAASGARRSGGVRTEMRNAVYSPCNKCTSKPEDTPLWQIKAKKVVHDQVNKVIEYTDATMEIAGIPVAYTPFFSHADPSVKRKSGILRPSIGGSTALGTTFSLPYFLVLAPNRDLTVTPMITSKERVVLSGEYRDLRSRGEIDVRGSATYNSENTFRGHIDGKARYDINDTWRAGLDLQRTSDDTYLRRYDISSPKTMTSRLYAEGFNGRDYMLADSYAFQGLSENDDPGKTPIVLPILEYHRISEAGRLGAKTTLDASFQALTRSDSTDTRRLSIEGGWHLPYIGSFGEVIDLSASLRGDLYHVSNLANSSGPGTDSGIAGRIVPQLKIDLGLPLSRQQGRISQTIEPLASFIISPYGGNPEGIPNEDSVDLEFDDTNLFSSNRFTGLDRVETGPRVNYGLKYGVFGIGGGSTTFFIGQSYRARTDSNFGAGSGLEDHFSDIVSRVTISPGKLIKLNYRTRLDKEDLSPRRNEISFIAGPPALRLFSEYVFFDRQENSEFGGREEFNGSLSSQINRNWRSSISGRYDLEGKCELRNIGMNLTYECDCFVFSTTINREFFEDRDVQPSDSILFRLTFKTLGDVKTGISRSGG